MGYCVDWDVNIKIPKKNINEALAAINVLMLPENVAINGRGGSWSGSKKNESWYSWVDTPPDNKYDNISYAFEGWGFNGLYDKEGNYVIDSCNNEKLGQEELLLNAIAPFVDLSSYVACHGEDDAHWRWVFNNGKMVEQRGTITYK